MGALQPKLDDLKQRLKELEVRFVSNNLVRWRMPTAMVTWVTAFLPNLRTVKLTGAWDVSLDWSSEVGRGSGCASACGSGAGHAVTAVAGTAEPRLSAGQRLARSLFCIHVDRLLLCGATEVVRGAPGEWQEPLPGRNVQAQPLGPGPELGVLRALRWRCERWSLGEVLVGEPGCTHALAAVASLFDAPAILGFGISPLWKPAYRTASDGDGCGADAEDEESREACEDIAWDCVATSVMAAALAAGRGMDVVTLHASCGDPDPDDPETSPGELLPHELSEALAAAALGRMRPGGSAGAGRSEGTCWSRWSSARRVLCRPTGTLGRGLCGAGARLAWVPARAPLNDPRDPRFHLFERGSGKSSGGGAWGPVGSAWRLGTEESEEDEEDDEGGIQEEESEEEE
ncbi:hypothetical protein HYH03_004957 [Edaphochlamys debaryana]|uniref:Uncharacterized protein n=1 Tax=Edaphochlamys debaryana TaxID=47281 RepID=A0A835Y6J7_9CHLO|nr:hypothetical protein HYH03_004957 [Edaphochlamys debaryana]|eukprot:KAG2496951.1 hypothetical protein HYH03_004957 [Edaphochlamys debaryana]